MTEKTKLKAFVMYLDPADHEDRRVIKFLAPKIKRRKVSGAIREAVLFYLRYMNRAPSEFTQQIEEEASVSPLAADLKPTPVSGEAARTFLKSKRGEV